LRLPDAREEIVFLLRAAYGLLADARPGHSHLDARVHFLHGLDNVVVLHPILVERHVAILPWSIHLIADGPETDIEWRRVTVLCAHFAHARRDGAIAVLHLLGRLARRAE